MAKTMSDLERVAEAYECAAIVAAHVIANDSTISNGNTEVDILNDLRNTMQKYISNYGNFKISTSFKKTQWEKYRDNAKAFIDLAKHLAGQ